MKGAADMGVIVHPRNIDLHAPVHEFSGMRSEMLSHPERPERLRAILDALDAFSWPRFRETGEYNLEPYFLHVHDSEMINYFRELDLMISQDLTEGGTPDTFPPRSGATRPRVLRGLMGWYCFDAQTPFLKNTWNAACSSFATAIQAAELLASGKDSLVYALCRPPGHHAGREFYGGYCYLNNAAGAVTVLGHEGRCAILDIDYHHGNGTQDIFYSNKDVFYASIHADPAHAFPFFSGYETERGEKKSKGHNLNIALPTKISEETYLKALDKAIAAISRFKPKYLVISYGTDIVEGDPVGDFGLSLSAIQVIGERIKKMNLPTLVVQEGGYNTDTVGQAVVRFLQGLSGEELKAPEESENPPQEPSES